MPHDLDARLVVLPPEHPFSKENGSPAEKAAREILESRGNAPRLYRNTLVFLAADKVRMQDLDEALRKYLAWASILAEKETLDLSPFQVRQAKTQKQAADAAVTARLPETYQWVLAPEQKTPEAAIAWLAIRISGADALAARAGKRLRSDELLVASLGSTILRKHLDEVPLWRGEGRREAAGRGLRALSVPAAALRSRRHREQPDAQVRKPRVRERVGPIPRLTLIDGDRGSR